MRQLITTQEGINDLANWLETQKLVSFDLETAAAEGWETDPRAALDPYKGRIVLILVGNEERQYIIDNRANLDLTPVQKLVESEIPKVGVNLRFDAKFVQHHFGWRPRRLVDNMIIEQNLRAGLFSADDKVSAGEIRRLTGMAALARRYLGKEINKDKELRTSFGDISVGELSQEHLDYLAGDLVYPQRILKAQTPLIKERGLSQVLKLESRLIPVLADMELQGMKLDRALWLRLYQESVAQLMHLERELNRYFGVTSYRQEDLFGAAQVTNSINYGSWQQLAKVLHKHGIPGFYENGKPQSTEAAKILLGKLEGTIPAELADLLLQYKKVAKRIESYGLNFVKLIHPVTGCIHPDFTQSTLVTGRISCSPGLQTIPKDSQYRHAFIAGDGYKMSIADASQIEARINGDLTEDWAVIKVFRENGDIYQHDGEFFYNTKIDKNTEEGKSRRNHAKVSWLGLGYGQGKAKFHRYCMVFLKQRLSRAETDFFYDKFFELHAQMKEKMDEWSADIDPEGDTPYFIDTFAEERVNVNKAFPVLRDSFLRKGRSLEEAEKRARRILANRDKVRYSTTYGGRKRFFRADYLGWWTAGRNFKIQGGAAQIQKESMVELAEFYWKNGYDAHLVNTVHDEIIVRGREDQIEDIYHHHTRIMTEVGDRYMTHVPMKVEGTISSYWTKA